MRREAPFVRRWWRPGALALIGLAVLTAMLGTTLATGVTIDPSDNNLTLSEGDTFNETITVTVPAGTTPTKADVYLLADTTGSMGGIIGAVKTGASSVVDGLIAALPSIDIAFGIGNYKDFPYDAYAFDHQVSVASGNSVAAKAGISVWGAGGGYDGPEGQLFALDQLAGDTDPAGGTIGWRSDAEKIIVWFGDAPGHDPVCSAISGLGYNITEGSATGKLVGAGMAVLAISTATGYPLQLDDNPTMWGGDYNAYCAVGGSAGQATRIANATGGAHVTGINSATIVNTIKNLVTTAVTTINNLSLVPTGGTAPFVTSIAPPSYGPLDGSVSHSLPFDVTFTGVAACTTETQVFTGTIDVVADGSVVAQKTVTITVPPCGEPTPTPPPPPEDTGFMTGGGNVTIGQGKSAARYTHGFEIRCDGSQGNLQYNDHAQKGNFHLESITSVTCTDDAGIEPNPPAASFDTLTLTGTGRWNGVSGATIEATLTDAGEPGRNDTMSITITDGSGVVSSVSGNLSGGNHQAHD